MKILTIATSAEGYFPLLALTAKSHGYDLKVLGWQKPWKGLAWKLNLYQAELERMDPQEPVVCVDGYDVVVVGTAEELHSKFLAMNSPLVFSGQRYFPRQKFMRSLADKLMSNDSKATIGQNGKDGDYSRPCTGLLMGYAGHLQRLFQDLLEIERKENIGNDQILLNIYHLRHPGSIQLDDRCELFQNLWRTEGGLLYGRILLEGRHCEIELLEESGEHRIRNKQFKTTPCFLHAPFNLDMGPVLTKLHLNPPTLSFEKNWHYGRYSLAYYLGRGLRFFAKELSLLFLAMLFLSLALHYIYQHAR